jgi:hypothetical protein
MNMMPNLLDLPRDDDWLLMGRRRHGRLHLAVDD